MYGKPAKLEGSDDEEDVRIRKESRYDRGFGMPAQKNTKAKVRQEADDKRNAAIKKEKEFMDRTGKVKKTD